MTWARFDDEFCFHPKVVAAGNEAAGAFARMVTHSCKHATDGHLSTALAQLIAGRKKVLERLVSVKLLVRKEDGYIIHDFLEYNPSSEEVKAQRSEISAKRAEAGRKGAESRWQNHGKTMAPAIDPPKQNDAPVPVPVPVSPSPPSEEELRAPMAPPLPPAQPELPQLVPAAHSPGTESTTPSPALCEAKPKPTKPRPAANDDEIKVFCHWQKTLDHPLAKLDGKRIRSIRGALASHGLETCLKAIDGVASSQWHRDNKQDDIELILRDASHIEKYVRLLDRANSPPRAQQTSSPCATAEAFEAEAAERERTGPINYAEYARNRAAALEARE